MILVIGATGTIGSELVRQLVEGRHEVRALVRDAARAVKLGKQVEIVSGDLAKPETLGAAFAGVDAAFVAVPTGPELPTLEGNAYRAAKHAGTRHVVKISGGGGGATLEDFMAGTAFAAWHLEAETRLREFLTSWTILRPGTFDSNVLVSWNILERGGLFVPAGGGKDGHIDPHDIAAVALKALTTSGHEQKTYELTGPELLSYGELVQKLAKASGKALSYVDVPEAEWRQQVLGAGMPAAAADSLLRYFSGVRAGRAYLTSTVSEVLGRPARSFDDWIRAHATELGMR